MATGVKKFIKNLFIKTNTLFVLDGINYLRTKWKFSASNKKFRKDHPDFALPPDYYLYETSKLDYRQYKEEGELAAKDILQRASRYLHGPLRLLEWGCGVARLVRHMPKLAAPGSTVTGIDINEEMIRWNKTNINGVRFETIDYQPPTKLPALSADFIFAFSVFTHIEGEVQKQWLQEIHRLLADGGIFMFTTHGTFYEKALQADQLDKLQNDGFYTVSYKQKGHRMMSTYNREQNFRSDVSRFFDVLEFYDGKSHPQLFGGQDLWIVKKR